MAGSPATTARSGPRASRRLRACHECDLLVALPVLRAGEHADCPRCGYTLVGRHDLPVQQALALALAALVCLALALVFPFVGFEAFGVGNSVVLTQTATMLVAFDQPLVGLAVLLTVIVLPASYLFGVVWLQFGLLDGRPLRGSRRIARTLAHLAPWAMADVFVVGALVSVIKVAGLADLVVGIGFWMYCLFALLLLKVTQTLDADWLWYSLAGEPRAPEGSVAGASAAAQGLTGCGVCGLVNRLDATGRGKCRRCGEGLHARRPRSVQATWALLLASVVLYVPSHVFPIMVTTNFGSSEPSTIIGGVIAFAMHGDLPIAFVIFTASVLVPVAKMLAIAWLCVRVRYADRDSARVRTLAYRLTEFIGRWSMVDIFVVAVLVALIRAGALMSIEPGPAALAFAVVVVLTMLAAMAFDPRLLWDSTQRTDPT